MSGNPTWNSWFSFPIFAPLSGAVTQDITTAPYQGVPEIELAIIREVGSFGQQLGVLSEAIQQLAEHMKIMPPAPTTAALEALAKAGTEPTPLEKLAGLIEGVNTVKKTYEAAVERDAAQALGRLRRTNAKTSKRLAERFTD